MTTAPGPLFALLAFLCFVLYFIPSLIAADRHHRNAVPLFIVNLFFGWTLVGWVITLAWAFSNQRTEVSHG